MITWASDNKYHFLSSYQQWVDGAIFYPISGVETRVEIEPQGPLVDIPQCGSCVSAFRMAKLVDSIMSVNWGQIDTFDITSVVSFFLDKECDCEIQNTLVPTEGQTSLSTCH